MFPKKLYKRIGKRVERMKLGVGTYYEWDKKKECLKMAQPFRIYCMYSSLQGGAFLVGMHALDIYLKTHRDDILEEGSDKPPPMGLKDFATMMIQGGELITIICLCFLNYVFLQRLDTFMFLFNQLIDYNKKLTEMINAGKLTLPDNHQFAIRACTALFYALMVVTAMLPMAVLLAVSAEVEPHHQIVKQWLEIELELKLVYLPFIVPFFIAIYSAGTTTFFMTTLISMYYITTTICTEAFTPEEIVSTPPGEPHRCMLATNYFGILSDMEVIHLYRTQQVLNVLLNAFFRSVLIAFHHCGCLATLVVLLVFLVKYNAIISEQGPIGYVIVVVCMFTPIVLIFTQAKMAGAVVDISEDFASSGKNFVPRKYVFRKFTRSCTIFYIQVTYPFYTVHKETFTQFCEQAQDYSMELLCY